MCDTSGRTEAACLKQAKKHKCFNLCCRVASLITSGLKATDVRNVVKCLIVCVARSDESLPPKSLILSRTAHEKLSRRRKKGSRAMTHPSNTGAKCMLLETGRGGGVGWGGGW